jgi:hypothetical protein
MTALRARGGDKDACFNGGLELCARRRPDGRHSRTGALGVRCGRPPTARRPWRKGARGSPGGWGKWTRPPLPPAIFEISGDITRRGVMVAGRKVCHVRRDVAQTSAPPPPAQALHASRDAQACCADRLAAPRMARAAAWGSQTYIYRAIPAHRRARFRAAPVARRPFPDTRAVCPHLSANVKSWTGRNSPPQSCGQPLCARGQRRRPASGQRVAALGRTPAHDSDL